MIEKPDIPDEVILRALEVCYSIRGETIEFVLRGLDTAAWAYRVNAGDMSYFLKVSKGSPDQTGAWIPRFLAQQGMQQVIAPLPTKQGEAFGILGGLSLRLQPFIPGERAMDAGMSSEQWKEFGAFLGRLHSLELATNITSQLRRETFTPRRLEWVAQMNARIHVSENPDPTAAVMISVWRENHARISVLLERTAALARRVWQAERRMVLCHGDIHTGNILLAEDQRMYVVDWDDAKLAPKERDLMFVLAEANAEEKDRFFAGYGETDVEPLALAYYQHDWCVEDIGAFAVEILDLQATGEDTRANSLYWFRSLFAPGKSVATALANDVDLMPA